MRMSSPRLEHLPQTPQHACPRLNTFSYHESHDGTQGGELTVHWDDSPDVAWTRAAIVSTANQPPTRFGGRLTNLWTRKQLEERRRALSGF